MDLFAPELVGSPPLYFLFGIRLLRYVRFKEAKNWFLTWALVALRYMSRARGKL
jgi:hypothetical protein